jgi:hypothetical protein
MIKDSVLFNKAMKKWMMPLATWALIISQLDIMYKQ